MISIKNKERKGELGSKLEMSFGIRVSVFRVKVGGPRPTVKTN